MNRPLLCGRAALLTAALALNLVNWQTALVAQDKFIFNHLEGEIVSIEPGKITWTDKSNVPHIAFVTKETKVQVSGEIEASAIAPGAYLRFTIPVTPKRLQPIKGAKVEELTLFSPGDGYQLGLLPDNVVDPQAKSVSCLVAGQVKQLKKGLLTMVINGKQFKVTLADEAKIKVDVSDYSIARKGDNIVLTGTGANQREIECKGVEINLASVAAGDAVNKPAADAKKPKRGAKPAAKPATSKPAKKPTKPDEPAADDAEPAAEPPIDGAPAAEVPIAPDNSLTLDEYIELGVPASDRTWTITDYPAALEAFGKLAKDESTKLPRYRSAKSGKLFDRMVAEDEGTAKALREQPLVQRLQHSEAVFEGTRKTMLLYAESSNALQAAFDEELVDLMAACVRTRIDLNSAAEEFLKGLEPTAPNFTTVTEGVEQLQSSLPAMTMSFLTSFGEKQGYRSVALVRFAENLEPLMPRLMPLLSTSGRKELCAKLRRLAQEEKGKPLHAGLEKLSEAAQQAATTADEKVAEQKS